jgi:hypothetical protein
LPQGEAGRILDLLFLTKTVPSGPPEERQFTVDIAT